MYGSEELGARSRVTDRSTYPAAGIFLIDPGAKGPTPQQSFSDR